MSDLAKFSAGWTESEQWAWEQIAAGEPADFNARDRRYYSGFSDLDPCNENGWAENRRLRVKFLQDISTRKVFTEATPDAGVRILGALVNDNVPLNLEHARLQRLIWLERSRILTNIRCRNIRVDGDFSLEGSCVGGLVELMLANVGGNVGLGGATLKAKVDLRHANIKNLDMDGATFEGEVGLNSVKMGGVAFLRDGATFKAKVDLGNASIDSNLEMVGATFEGKVDLNSAKVGGATLCGGATFKAEVALVGASIGSVLDMRGATFEGVVDLNSAKVGGAVLCDGATFKAEVALVGASIGSSLDTRGATFEGAVNLNSAKVDGSAFLREGATFKAKVDLGNASIDSNLEMVGATFEGKVDLNSAKVGGATLCGGATFKADVALVNASVGSNLDMRGATFEGAVNLNSAKVGGAALCDGATFKAEVEFVSTSIGADLDMSGATFESEVDLSSAEVSKSVYLRGATFKDNFNLIGTDISSDLDFSAASFTSRVNMTGCQIKRELRLGSSRHKPAHWEDAALLVLRNAHVGALQDWWRNSSENSWPKALELEGFTFDRLGGLFGTGKEANMMDRESRCYIEWLGKDMGSSAQPYEHLASLFRRAGDPGKANDLLYAARERRRRLALSGVDNWGHRKDREVLRGVGLWMLRLTIGYGLGNRYFLVLLWVGGLSVLGMFVLMAFGTQSPALWSWPSLFFASLDQLLPIITLNKAYDVLIFGDPSATLSIAAQPPWLLPQPPWVQFYFYFHMMVGWVLGSFIVAGLAGLTQRN